LPDSKTEKINNQIRESVGNDPDWKANINELNALRAKLDNRELGDNVESIEDDDEVPYGEAPSDKEECPVCNRCQTHPDRDFPDTLRCCLDCGAEYVTDGMAITFDPREELTSEEISLRGYNSL
jgi:hypothetical protein